MSDSPLSPLQQAALALRKLRARVDTLEQAARAPIGVIGLACRYPGGAIDGDRLWRNLIEGVDATSEIPPDRWDVEAYYDPRPGVPGRMYTRRGGFIDGVDEFDPQFFRIAPRDAIGIDPQQRLLLQTVWHALEDAGLPPPTLQGKPVGVFLGISTNDYSNLLSKTAFGSSSNAGAGAGNAASVASGRISYTFGFQGPCFAVDTACSSSLVATHLAVQALRAGECDIAVVAGVNLMLAPDITVNFCQGRMLSPDGRCKTFDAGADGYARAEGCGVLILERLADAGQRRVRAVIRGSALNQDGRSAGLTAPSGPAQEAVIRAALANAGLTPADVDAIEAHGTGTGLGDPIEAHALAAVFKGRDRPLWVGSIKSNMGHAEAAAGVAGMIKAVLMAERGAIPPSLHFHQLNPHIDTGTTDIRVPVTMQPIRPRAVGVSSFGFSGTNAHILVAPPPEGASAAPAPSAEHTPRLLISARTPDALQTLIAAYRQRLDAAPESFLDICHSAAAGRARLPWWVCVERPEELASAEPQHGTPPDLGPQPGHQVPLPLYPFERQRYWIDTAAAPAAVVTALPKGAHPLLGRRLALPFSDERRFETDLAVGDPELSWLGEHRVLGQAVLPAAAIIELLHALAPMQEVSELELLLPIIVPDQPARRLQTILGVDGQCRIVAYDPSDAAGAPVLHARARLAPSMAPPTALPAAAIGTAVNLGSFYAELERRGIVYGPSFRGLRDLRRDGEAGSTALLALPEAAGSSTAYTLHPALLDAALQVVAAALPADDSGATLVPARIGRARLLRQAGTGLRATAVARHAGSGVLAQLRLEDDAGLVAFVEGIEFRPVTAASLRDGEAAASAADALYTLELEPCPRLDGLLAPDFLPSPDALRGHLAPLAQQLGERFGIEVYARTADAFDRITAGFIRQALQRLGLDWRPGGLLTFGALTDELGVADRHRRLLRRLLGILTEAEQLEPVGPAWRMLPAPDVDEPEADLAALVQKHPAAAAELMLVQRAGPRLAEVLTDSVDPLTLLFPGDGGGAAELYGSSAYARTVNALLGEAMARLRASLPPGRVLRILEVGAGTGGATAALLEALPEGTARYCFTDLSQLFLTAAAKRFARDDIHFAKLDIEQDPVPQGFARESMDLVIAANVLHATSDVRRSLVHIRSLLAPGGILVLVETTEARRWVDIVFGLTEGWWRFADRELRPDHPLLSRTRWLDVLAEVGFTADALPAGEIALAQKPLPATLPEPAVRLLGDPGRVQGVRQDPHAAVALYAAPTVPPTAAGLLALFDELLGAVRALAAEARPPALTILSDGSLAHAGLPGFLRTLRLEQPKLRARLLEAPPAGRALLDELGAPDGESHLIWQDGRRRAPRLRPSPVLQPLSAVGGSWVITGGSGGLGRAVAAWLATHGASRIVLVARGRAESLPDLAVPVEMREVDVADADAMEAILTGLPDLQGVVHAAGQLDDAPVLEQTRTHFAAVMRAKIEGALNLDRLTSDRPGVQLVLFASIAGVLGSAEQINHAAASSFLDALAHDRRNRGLPAIVIDWGVWRGIGAAARLGVVERAEKLGLGSIAPATGIAAFAHALGAAAPVQLAVLPGVDWGRFLGQFAQGEQPSLLQGLVTDRPEPASATPATSAVGPTQRIARIVADVVGLPSPADPETPLPDFGLDSLMAVEIRNRIQREVAIEVGVRELLEGVTIAAIAARAGDGAPPPPSRLIEPDVAGRFAPFPLTEIQQAYWIGRGDTLELGNVGCYLYTEVELKGVDLARLERAWNLLVRRHDMLRAVVLPDGQQQILPTVPEYSIVQRDLSGDDAEAELLALRERLSHRLPDPAVWPLFDLRATHHPGGTRLHIGLDLLVLDAASIFQLREEWGRLYEDPTTALPPIGLSFRDYVLEGLAWRRSDAWQRSARYWEERVASLPGGPDLPLARQPGQISRPRFVRRLAVLPAEQWQQLQAAGQARGLTPSALLAAAYADVLAAWSRSARFCVTLTSFNRPPLHPDIGALIGDFTSTILLEVDTTPATFAERATALAGRLAADLDHAEVGGVHVLRELARTRGSAAASIPVVFTSALGFRAPEGTSSSWDRISDMVHSVAQTPQVWIDHQASEHAGGLLYTWDVLEDLFPAGLIETMFAAYGRLLGALAAGDGWQAPVAARAELPARPAPLVAFEPAPLFAGFLAQAAVAPDSVAVVDGAGTMRYGELERLSAAAARRLLALGAEPGRVVAVDLGKSRAQVAAVLAVNRAGAAYLPLDPALPTARRDELVQDTAAITPDWPSLLAAAAADGPGAVLPVVDPASLAYVIFTSGSTGRPKGVMVEHAAALNTVLEVNRRWRVGPADRVLGLSALNFDLSVWDLFGLLAAGGAVVLPDEAERRDPAAWARLLGRHGVTVWNTVPALAAMLAEHGLAGAAPPRLFLLSGDWVPLELVPRLRALAPTAELVALGGATEAAIWSLAHAIGASEPGWPSVPYGRALANQSMHVVNQRLEPCPDWVVGEIEIGGIGLARGYWGDPLRTAERFRTDPLTGERRYRTGDLGRFRPGQLLEFLGREDFQVKIQGHRIELGEIEAHLLQHPAVLDAVAAALPATGQPNLKTLHAFVVPRHSDGDADLWSTAVAEATAAVQATAAPITPDLFDAAADRLTRFTAGAAARALDRLGAFALPADRDGLPSVDAVIEGLGVLPAYRRWLTRALELIRRHGRQSAGEDPLRDFAAFDRFGFGPADLDLLRRLTVALPDILIGRAHAADIYLDAGTPEIYAKLFQVPYDVLGRTIAGLATVRRLSILEVGAGLGTTLVALQAQLPLDRVRYCFTDVSPHFLHLAERRLGRPPWLELAQLDLTAPVGDTADVFDVVIASSVLHAVPDPAVALSSICRRLRPGGLLLIVEETRFLPWYDLSMGLQSGFDSFTDLERRTAHPLLSREAWRELLHAAGFARVDIPLAEGSIGERLGLDVILASLPATAGDAAAATPGDLGPELRRFLGQRLPDYMVPRLIHRIDRLPLTANGKVDRGALGGLATRGAAPGTPDQPASPAERGIATLVGEILGTEPPSPLQSFFDLGADSLKLVMIQRRLKEALGRSPDMSALFANPTVRGIAAGMAQADERPMAAPLVLFSETAAAPILFTVPGVVAMPYYLQPLARALAPGVTLAGLQLPGLVGDERPLDRIEAQAAYLVAAMRSRQPHGPYRLLGHSFGGTVAFEAARQLRFQGEEVGFLGLLDTVVTESSLDDFQNDRVAQGSIVRALYALYGDRLPVPLETMRSREPAEQLAAAMQALTSGGLLDLEVAVAGVLAVFKANFRAMATYRPGSYDGPLTLFRTEGGFPEEYHTYESGRALEDPALGWTPFVTGPLTVDILPGDHLGMLDADRLPTLAARLLDRLAVSPVGPG